MPKGIRGRVSKRPRGTMNRTEERYARRLELLRCAGTIRKWYFGAWRFRLADSTWYEPDFVVILPDGQVELHEVKGFMRDDSAVKIKVTADIYWEFPVFVVREVRRDEWDIKEVRGSL